MQQIEIMIYNSITELRIEDWNKLASDNIFMCYEYLKTLEETRFNPLQPFYITANYQGKIIAASACHLFKKNDTPILDKVLLGRLFHFKLLKKISFLPALICNYQRGSGTHFLFSDEITEENFLLIQNKMLDEIERIAKNYLASITFLNLANNQNILMQILRRRGYFLTLDLPSNFLDVKWSSLEGYLEYVSQKYPYMKKSIRHHINKNKKAGVIIKRHYDDDDEQKRLMALLKMNHSKYSSAVFPLKSNYLRKIKENFGDNAIIYVAEKEDTVIGVNIILKKGEEAFFSVIGIDHERSQNDLTFFNLGYYSPISNASEFNINRIYFGRGLYHTKIKRGCKAEDMYILYMPENTLIRPVVRLWFFLHRQWMKYKISNIKKL